MQLFSKSSVLKLIKFNWKILDRKQKFSFFILLLLIFFSLFIEMIGIGLIVSLISIFLDENFIANFKSQNFYLLNFLFNFQEQTIIKIFLFLMIFIYFFKAIYLTLLNYFVYKFTHKIKNILTNTIFKKYMDRPYIFFINKNYSQLINNTVLETEKYQDNILAPSFLILTETTFIIGIAIILLAVQPFTTFFMIFFSFIMIFFFNIFTKNIIVKRSFARQFEETNRSNLLKNSFIAIKDIKILNFENFFIEKYSHISKSLVDMQIKIDCLRQIPRLWIEFFAIFILIFLVFFFKSLNFLDKEIIKILGLAAIASFKLLPSLNKIIIAVQQYKYGSSSFVTIKKELKTLSTDKEKILYNKNIEINQSTLIEFKNISFRYPYSKKIIFENFNIDLKIGDFVGISGPSGCGKSTLSDVLLGILPRTSGHFFVNHKSYKKSLINFNNIAYVSQHIYLFDEDIVQNITFGSKLPIDMKKIWKVLQVVNLDHFINSLPKKLNTKISDRGGMNISGGQRQRLAIARALYSDPKILILDEATSALDSKTESIILKKIKNIFRDKIVISITHKKSLLNSCNKVYEFVLKKNGNYSLLIKNNY